MPEYDIPVVRIVVKGCPSTRSEKTNIPRARNMLLRAFEDNHWPGNAMFAITPGGFVKAPFPDPWDRERGWSTSAEDFRTLVPHARKAVDEVVTPQVLDAARGRADFLTLGVDLNDRSCKRKMDRKSRGTHAELVAIVDVERGGPVWWTGKSYPLSWQERSLVQEADLESHLFHCGSERLLVLGCHDLNMFSERAKSGMKPGRQKHARSNRMRKLVTDFRPTMILHHPHSTDMMQVWSTAWSGARAFLPRKYGAEHVWASGVAYYNGGEKPRGKLRDVLRATRCCEEQVVDILVKPSN